MSAVHIRPEAEGRANAIAAFDRHRGKLRQRLPYARVDHVGSTSVPGALTKGDVDLLVRVDSERFDEAAARLREGYAVHQPENWTATYASFVDPSERTPPVGVQLVVAGSSEESLFIPFREALIADSELLSRYNELKARHDGESYELYTSLKGRFVEEVLAALAKRAEGRPGA
jgi:GrpB-like predicted nucleotidyltransferase (UPF0157 family)